MDNIATNTRCEIFALRDICDINQWIEPQLIVPPVNAMSRVTFEGIRVQALPSDTTLVGLALQVTENEPREY